MMQAVKFKHIEEFLDFLPEQELRITLDISYIFEAIMIDEAGK